MLKVQSVVVSQQHRHHEEAYFKYRVSDPFIICWLGVYTGQTHTCHTHPLKSQCASLQNELSNLRLWSCSVYMGWNGLDWSRTWVLSSYPPRPCTPHSSMLPRSVTVSLLWDSCSSSASDSESCRDNLLLFKLPTRRMLDKEPPFFTWKLRVPLIWSRREPPILIFLLGTVLKE